MKLQTRVLIFFLSLVLCLLIYSSIPLILKICDDNIAKCSNDVYDVHNEKEKQLNNLFHRIITANSLDYKNYTLNIVDEVYEANSPASMRRGKILFFNKTFLTKIKTEQGLAFIIAHELSHYELGHLNNLSDMLFAQVKSESLLKNDMGNAYFSSKYSQNNEIKADLHAIDLLIKTFGINNLVFQEITERLTYKSDKLPLYDLDENVYIHTHPRAETRALRIMRKLTELTK